jgi:hypothetical protein
MTMASAATKDDDGLGACGCADPAPDGGRGGNDDDGGRGGDDDDGGRGADPAPTKQNHYPKHLIYWLHGSHVISTC